MFNIGRVILLVFTLLGSDFAFNYAAEYAVGCVTTIQHDELSTYKV